MAAATALAIGGMAISAASSGASFAQAGKQRQLQQKAEAEAAKALEEARKRTEVNVYEQIGIQKEPYALQREAMLVQGAQGIQAAMEGDQRGVAATAGRIQAAQNEAQAQITAAMGKEMTDLEKLQAAEEARLMNVNLELDKGQIIGAQQAAADAGAKAAASTQAGFTSLAAGAKQGLEAFVPLFSMDTSPAPISTEGLSRGLPVSGIPTLGGQQVRNNLDITTMSPLPYQFNALMPQISPINTGGLYRGNTTPSFGMNYNFPKIGG